jgi:hypothetical protein
MTAFIKSTPTFPVFVFFSLYTLAPEKSRAELNFLTFFADLPPSRLFRGRINVFLPDSVDFFSLKLYNGNITFRQEASMKNPNEITLRLPEDLLRKLIYVSTAEGRSPNNHMLMLLRNSIQYFERTKGRIPQSELQKIDLSAPSDEEN